MDNSLIKRQAAIDVAVNYHCDHDITIIPNTRWTDGFETGWNLRENDIIHGLEELPPAQPQRMKGRWIDGKCDKCGEHAPYWAMASTYYLSDFCPNCGADMRCNKNEQND